MAGKAPFFITGANCKVKVNGITLAYATELSYQISIPHAKPKVLGVYEASSFDPLSYDVSGSFTVIKYVEGSVKRIVANHGTPPNGASNDGNGVGSWTPNRGQDIKNRIANALGKTSDGRAQYSLNPYYLQDAMFFDIEVYQNVQRVQKKATSFVSFAANIADSISDNVPNDISGIARLRNCRIINASAVIQKRGVMQQTFQFIAQYADEDSFIADPSGQGQLEA